jgi:hypothetical protein
MGKRDKAAAAASMLCQKPTPGKGECLPQKLIVGCVGATCQPFDSDTLRNLHLGGSLSLQCAVMNRAEKCKDGALSVCLSSSSSVTTPECQFPKGVPADGVCVHYK